MSKENLLSNGYHQSVLAVFDEKQYQHNKYTSFWESSVSRRLSRFEARRDAAGEALGKYAKTQASLKNQCLTESNFRPFEIETDSFNSLDKNTGELKNFVSRGLKVTEKVDSDFNKSERFRLQTIAASILPNSRTSKCLRMINNNASHVEIVKSKEFGTTSFTGLQTCGSVWSCPVCAARISERRRLEVQKALDSHLEDSKNSTAFITYTFPHYKEDDLKDMLKQLSKAMAAMKADRRYKELRALVGQFGTIRALEVTHGLSGWHPHIHEIWFCSNPLLEKNYNDIKSKLYDLWSFYAVKFDFSLPSEKYGVDVKNGDFVADYISKFGREPISNWSADAEISKAVIKKAGCGGRSPFQILNDSENDKQFKLLFREYADSFKGKRQLVWSRGLKSWFEVDELTDDEINEMQEDNSNVVCTFTPDQWRFISSKNIRFNLLLLAQNSDSTTIFSYLYSIGLPPPE